MEAVTVDTPGRDFPQGAIRVSDAERDASVAELSQHYQQGRLTAVEFDERSGQAFAAKDRRPTPCAIRRSAANRVLTSAVAA